VRLLVNGNGCLVLTACLGSVAGEPWRLLSFASGVGQGRLGVVSCQDRHLLYLSLIIMFYSFRRRLSCMLPGWWASDPGARDTTASHSGRSRNSHEIDRVFMSSPRPAEPEPIYTVNSDLGTTQTAKHGKKYHKTWKEIPHTNTIHAAFHSIFTRYAPVSLKSIAWQVSQSISQEPKISSASRPFPSSFVSSPGGPFISCSTAFNRLMPSSLRPSTSYTHRFRSRNCPRPHTAHTAHTAAHQRVKFLSIHRDAAASLGGPISKSQEGRTQSKNDGPAGTALGRCH
jgi:hypothetical protein